MKTVKNHDTKISLIIIGSFLALSFFLFYLILMTGLQLPTDKENYYPLIIPMGSNLSQVADSILTSGVKSSHREITTAGKMLGVDKLIKAGKYNLKAGMRLYEIFDLITSGEVDPVVVTIKEGWNSRRIAEEFSNKLNINKENFVSYLSDSVLISELGIAVTHLEGYLYPETYHFGYGTNERAIIKWMVRLFLDNIGSEERKRAIEISMTLNEIVTLASIIEGEVVHDKERAIVSSVYHNRLKQNMRLQADPTIQYILKDGPRRLSTKDLFIKSPYNTYRNSGLPPGPIGSPSIASIRAALWPEETEFIYFVATGKGYHTFSRTFEEHNEAKKKLQQLRRDFDRQSEERTEG